VPVHQIVFGALLVVLLLGMACYFAWRQGRVLNTLQSSDMTNEDRRYTRRQAWIRLICSGLLMVLAILLAASFFLEEPASQLVQEGINNAAKDERVPLSPEQQRFFDIYRGFWGFTLLVLLAVIVLAAVDFFTIRRYGLRQYRKIQAERRAMIESQLARIRSQKNGQDSI
jgi:hypothetical protein